MVLRCNLLPMRFLPTLILAAALTTLAPAQTICLDPGHPSEASSGTAGKHTTEIKVAWRIAVLVKAKLQAEGYRVVMTKTKEQQYVTNKHRAEIANAAGAALLLRLHCDAASDSGFGVYYPARTGRARDGHRGPSADVLRMCKPAAGAFHAVMAAQLKGQLRDRGLMTDMQTAIGAKQGGALTGSIYSEVPTVLVEMVVLTNRHDEAWVMSKAGEKALSDAIAVAAEAAVGKR